MRLGGDAKILSSAVETRIVAMSAIMVGGGGSAQPAHDQHQFTAIIDGQEAPGSDG